MFAAPVLAQNVKENFTGFAINMNGAANTATIDFTIERWSTDAERKTLLVADSRRAQVRCRNWWTRCRT